MSLDSRSREYREYVEAYLKDFYAQFHDAPQKDNEYLGDNTVRILLDFFVYNGKNYDRFSEEFNEKAYSVNELKSVLNNFNIIGIYDELNLEDIKDDSERIYFVLKKGDN